MGKLELDRQTVAELESMPLVDKIALLNVYNISYHKTGKIEGVESCDSTCSCEFCEAMKRIPNSICAKCYADRQAKQYKGIEPRHKLNAEIMSKYLFEVAELATLNFKQDKIRFNEDGDLINVTMARNYLRLAKAFPNNHFGFWFKNRVAMKQALALEGKPSNVTLIYSDPFVNGSNSALSVKPEYADYIFRVYDKAHILLAIADGAHVCNGRKCKVCGYQCYTGFVDNRPSDIIAEILK